MGRTLRQLRRLSIMSGTHFEFSEGRFDLLIKERLMTYLHTPKCILQNLHSLLI